MLRHRKRIRLLSYGTVAAAVIIGLVLIFTADFKSNSEKLIKKYCKPYEYIEIQSAVEDQAQYTYVVKTYINGNYSTGIGICREILNSEPQGPEYRFLYGLNLMGLPDSIESAIQRFDTLNT